MFSFWRSRAGGDALRERGLRRGLPVRIDGEHDIVPDRARLDRERCADWDVAGIDFETLTPRRPAQVGLERALGAVLADALPFLVTGFATGGELLVGDLTRVAEQVRGELPLGVVPHRQLLHLGAGIVLDVLQDRDTCTLGDAGRDDRGFQRGLAEVVEVLLELFGRVLRREHFGELTDHL